MFSLPFHRTGTVPWPYWYHIISVLIPVPYNSSTILNCRTEDSSQSLLESLPYQQVEGNLQYDNISCVQYSDFRNIFHKMTHKDYFHSNKNNRCILQYRMVQYFQNKLRLCTVYPRFMSDLFLTPIYARFKTGICRILVTSVTPDSVPSLAPRVLYMPTRMMSTFSPTPPTWH